MVITSTRHTGVCQPAVSYHLLGLLAPWYGARLPGWHALGHHRLGSPTLASSLVFPMLRCSGACLPACLPVGPGLSSRSVACGPANRSSQVFNSGLWIAGSSAAVSRNTKSRIDRETGWAEVAKLSRLQIATPHSSTAATARGPDLLLLVARGSFLQQPTSTSLRLFLHAL